GGHHEGAAREGVETCFHYKAVPLAHGVDPATDDEFSACFSAFYQQHVDDLLCRAVAKELSELLLVIGNTVFTNHLDEVERRKARERRLAEMGIGRHVRGRIGVYVGEVTAPSTRD